MEIIYRVIMEVRTIGNLRLLINVLLMLNLEKRELHWQHRLQIFIPNSLNERKESCLQ